MFLAIVILIDASIPESTGQYSLGQKSGPTQNASEYSKAAPSLSSKVSITLPTKTFSGQDIESKLC